MLHPKKTPPSPRTHTVHNIQCKNTKKYSLPGLAIFNSALNGEPDYLQQCVKCFAELIRSPHSDLSPLTHTFSSRLFVIYFYNSYLPCS
jgi:hypothetical protein